MKKLFNIILGTISVVLISALFPVFLVKVIGVSMPLTFETFIYYITLGVGLYLLFYVLKSLWFVSKLIYYLGKMITTPFKALVKRVKKRKK